jgi:hypothetical protein
VGNLSRFQIDLTADELGSIERWSSMAGFRTKKEFLLNAFTMFKWAAQQVLLGRTICAMNEATGEIRHLEMPALAAIAGWGVPPRMSADEHLRRIAEAGDRLPESVFRTERERDVEAERSLDPECVGRPESHLEQEPTIS